MVDIGLLLIRVVIGLLLIGHGTQKLFGWFGGSGIKGTGAWLESIGIRPGKSFAVLAGAAEFAGGLLFGSGLWLCAAAALIGIVMLVAIVKVHGANGLWAASNGFEYVLVLLVVVLGVAFIGAGDYSVASFIK